MKPFSEACEQNKAPILSVLKTEFSGCTRILEIGSGTGQHAVYFGKSLPQLTWQTSDLPGAHAGIQAWLDAAGCANVLAPIVLNVEQQAWPPQFFDGVFSANTTHIMHWDAVCAMFRGIGGLLAADGSVCLYGPFNYAGDYTSDSNARFDAWLKQRDPESGIRNFEDLCELAASQRLEFFRDYAMPVNNRILVWKKGRY